MLAWTIYLSLGAAAGLMFLPRGRGSPRVLALMTALACLALTLIAFWQNPGGEMRTVVRLPWIPTLGIEYHLAADGVSLVLVVLTGLAAVAGILFSWNVEERANEFFALFLALIGGVYGVFLSFDLFLFFVFYELAIIPKYFLIVIWGSTRKEYGAMKLALYSFAGSALVLIGLLAAYVTAGAHTFDLASLAQGGFARPFQLWAFPLVFVGFAILAGLWPFHTWAPTGHVAAPTAASMLLAGVVMKLGAYGCLRVAMVLFPEGLSEWSFTLAGLSSWREVFATMAAVGIVYGALVALVQRDFKFVIGYSSVSHMGFVLLGMLSLHPLGMAGSVLQMFSHGILAGLLFAVVGRMIYDRAHTRDFGELQGFPLRRALPFATFSFVVAGFASMGMPGFSGFVAELQVLIGAWHAFPALALTAGVGIVIGVAYTLSAMHKAFFNESPRPPQPGAGLTLTAEPALTQLQPISLPEKIGAGLLMIVSLVVGLYPRILLDPILHSLHGPLFQALLKGGNP